MTIEIREHRPGEDLRDFIQVPHAIFRDDPAWIPPLEMEMRDRLTPGKNPFFDHGEAALFTAWHSGRAVGRCSAQIYREHLRIHADDAGFFGFFDTVDDPEVAQALLGAAEGWLRDRGMKQMRGPMSLHINEETGLLIEGYDTPPVFMMNHCRPYQPGLVEACGLTKEKDLIAWRYQVGDVPKRGLRAWEAMQDMPEIRLRSVDRSHVERDLRIVMDIYNDAWSENWGFVPTTPEEVKKTVQDLKLILDPDIAFIAEIEERPVGMCICIPNLNEAIHDLGGKLFPFGIAKLLWRLKVGRPRSARLMLLGIRKELRGVKRYGGLSMAMYVELAKRGKAKGYEWCELSWTLEDNHPVNLGIRAMGGKPYKKYRVYAKELVQ